jgi:hypothetical protein
MNAIDFDNYLFRCHSLGKVMAGIEKIGLTDKQSETLMELYAKREANAAKGKFLTDNQTVLMADLISKRDAKPTISTGAQTYLKTLHREVFMKREKRVESKYLEKGIAVEEKSFSLYTRVFGKLLVKNKVRFANKFFTGEPDNTQKKVRDFKSSYDFSTFPLYETEITNSDYDWQLQGYMDLTKIHEGELVYCLTDTPFNIIEDEIRRMNWKHNILNLEGEIREESIPLVVEKVSGMIYTEEGLIDFCNQSPNIQLEWFENFFPLPEEMRIKVFETEYSKEKIQIGKEHLIRCREFMNNLTKTMATSLVLTA